MTDNKQKALEAIESLIRLGLPPESIAKLILSCLEVRDYYKELLKEGK
jgi:hypothetical protein